MKELMMDSKKIERKLVKFIKDEFKKRGFKKAVFGLSGGVDSSLVGFLLSKALGSENVVALFLPYKTSSKESEDNFDEVVKILGIKPKKIPITPMVDCFFKEFPDAGRIRRGNKMARERMCILYDQSKAEDALVVGSGNKTEILLGYATLFGDTACAINPIGGLYKTQVKELARHFNIPEKIITQAPTAGLWPGQTDEEELGLSYEKMDEILYFAVDKKYTLDRLAKRGFSKKSVKKVLDRVKKFKYKSELPAIAKI